MTTRRRRSAYWLMAGTALLLTSTAAVATAQDAGTLRGTVTAESSLRPLAAAQVSIPGTGQGTLTNNAGEFLIPNIAPGQHTLRVQMIGYTAVEQTVDVAAGQVTTVSLALSVEALALDEIVVTGVAGGTQRRAVGNVVDQISVAEEVELSPATSVNQMIAQRSPGVQLMGQSGTVGAGAPIHIRGVSSLELGARPLIYIDGVRMNSSIQGPGQRGGSRMSRLDDINLDDVESIEIIKGPAAATLYGTEASNGVIQIVTKRGTTGEAQFDVTTRVGTHWLWNPEERVGWSYDGGRGGEPLDSINLYAQERDNGPYGDPFKYGSLEAYDLSIRGGASLIRYFISGSFSDQTGVIPYNWEKHFTVRSNVEAVLSDQLTAALSMGYVDRSYRAAQRTLGTDHFGNLVWGSPAHLDTRTRGWLNAPPEASEEVDSRSEVSRTTTSLQLTYNPLEWFTNRLILGLDVAEDVTSTLYPRHPDGRDHWWGTLSLGDKSVGSDNDRVTTLDYGASADAGITDDLTSTTSVGLQYYHERGRGINASGSEFAAPPLTTVSAAAIDAGGEGFSESASVGVYVQEQLAWRDRVFLTGAIRGDDNSAFGAEYDAAIYPKLSATWVLHEEPFWNLDWVSQLRLRGAWGAAGQQPGQFAAVRLYNPVTGYQDRPGLEPGAVGNDQLKPERSEELELGFDLSLLDDRIEVLFTRYDRSVTDALLDRPLPPSEGFSGSQTVNMGEVKAWGNEIAINARVIDGRRIGYDLGVNFATMRNRIESLGEVEFGPTSSTVEGFSIADRYEQTVVSADFVSGTSGPVTNIMCDGGAGPSGREMGGAPVPCDDAPDVRWGPSQATWQANLVQTLSIGQSLLLNASIDATGGHWQLDSTAPASHTSYCLTRACRLQDDPIVQAYRAIGRNPLGLYEAGFARLREVSATYTIPQAWVGALGASRGSISLAGRNMMTLWTAQHGWGTPRSGLITIPIGEGKVWDPEVRGTGARSSGYQTVMPPLATGVLTLRVSF
ncbi:MAG: SusC/RagA family TonB-linked outer membrane protein [Gemmatimonadota bacterium]